MMEKCPFCFNEVKENAKFCGKCGKQIAGDLTENSPVNQPSFFIEKFKPALTILICFFIANISIILIGHFLKAPLLRTEFFALGFLSIIILITFFQFKSCTFSVFRPSKGMLITIPVTTVAIIIFMLGYIYILKYIAVDNVKYLTEYKKAGLPVWSAFVAMALWPAIFEELAFRGVIYNSILSIGSPKEAIILQALLFSVAHLSPAIFISHFVIGLALGWIANHHKSLLPSMIVHFLYNSSILLLEYFKHT